MLSSWTLRYSGVNGACCPTPRSLVGSNLNCPPTVPGLTIAFHCPFRSGNLPPLATCALPLLISSAQANPQANPTPSMAIELRSDRLILTGGQAPKGPWSAQNAPLTPGASYTLRPPT